MVPISRPNRTRSSDELPRTPDGSSEAQLPTQTERKKSQTSTQSTCLDTPPKSPPHYGNTLTVDTPSLDETVTDFQCLLKESNIRNTNVDVENDFIELEVSKIQKANVNGAPRPGTPVRRSRNRVGFIKPTLTVTLDIGDMAHAAVNENVHDTKNEDNIDFGNQKVDSDPSLKTKWKNFRGGDALPGKMNGKNIPETGR